MRVGLQWVLETHFGDSRTGGDEGQKQGFGWTAKQLSPWEEQWALERGNRHELEINPTFFTFVLKTNSS